MLHGLPLHGLGIARLGWHGMEVLRLFLFLHGFSFECNESITYFV